MGCVESPGLEGEESVRRVKEGGSILPGEERVAGGASEEAGFEARPCLETSYPGKPIVALIPVEESWSRPREERVGSRVESGSTMLDSSWGRASWSERDREGSMAGSWYSGRTGAARLSGDSERRDARTRGSATESGRGHSLIGLEFQVSRWAEKENERRFRTHHISRTGFVHKRTAMENDDNVCIVICNVVRL